MATSRRVGAETSKTRDQLLNGAERLMITKGYAAVSYRAVAATASVTGGLVQYYFPTLDDLLVAVVRRRSQENLERLTGAFEQNPNQPLRVIWEFSRDEMASTLAHELLALGNHRPAIHSELAQATDQIRKLQAEALAAHAITTGTAQLDVSIQTLLFLFAGVPKLFRLEEGVGVTTMHREVLEDFELYLDKVEPVARPAKRARGTSRRSR